MALKVSTNWVESRMASADAERILSAQRRLKQSLLDSQALSWRPARDLAAQMLLCLEAPQSCWKVAAEWLLDELGVERVDGGWAQPTDDVYRAAQFEVIRDTALPSMAGLTVKTRSRTLALLWNSSAPLVQEDMASTCLFDDDLRRYFLSQGVHTKMTTSIVHRGRPVGLICVDRVTRQRRWNQWQYDCFSAVVNQVMAPILDEVGQIHQTGSCGPTFMGDAEDGRFPVLTPTESKICDLAVQGWSYKEIAREMGRSLSTVDHHLRSVRQKLGVSSTAKLVTALSGHRSARSNSN